MSLQLAEQFEANEQYEDAYREYKKEFDQNPEDLGLMERLGHLSLILEKPEEAAWYYHEILKRDVANPLAYEQLISIYENTDKYKYYIYRANLYRQQGKDLKAIDEYNIILEYDNLHEEIFLQLADIYMKEEAYPSAIDVLQRAKQKGFDTDRINEGLAAVYLKSGDAASAIKYTKDELLIIQCMLELGQIDEAYAKLNSIPDEFKNSPRYFTLQAQYCYSAKDFKKALEYIDEYNKLSPNSPLTFQMRALVYDEEGDEYNAHVNWGKYNMLRKNTDIAVNEFLNAVQLKDDDIDLLFLLAGLLTDSGETNHAAEYYEKIAKLDPTNKEALRKLAKFREGIGDYRMQVKYLEKIVEADSKDIQALKELAKACEKIKDSDGAIEAYNKCLDLISDPAEIQLIKSKLEKLESHGASNVDESVGLLDKIMGFFNKG